MFKMTLVLKQRVGTTLITNISFTGWYLNNPTVCQYWPLFIYLSCSHTHKTLKVKNTSFSRSRIYFQALCSTASYSYDFYRYHGSGDPDSSCDHTVPAHVGSVSDGGVCLHVRVWHYQPRRSRLGPDPDHSLWNLWHVLWYVIINNYYLFGPFRI